MFSKNLPGPSPEEQIGAGLPPQISEESGKEPSMKWAKDANGEDVLVTNLESFNPDEEVPAN